MGFTNHIKLSHYMWNYIYFIAYLRWKPKINYSGIESYIADRLDENDTSWFPLGKAREIEDESGD